MNMPPLYRINVKTQFELETTQKILFKMGHSWSASGTECNRSIRLPDSIGVWDSMKLTHMGVNSPTNLTFEEFITKMENEL
jgi:hypothetical protein